MLLDDATLLKNIAECLQTVVGLELAVKVVCQPSNQNIQEFAEVVEGDDPMGAAKGYIKPYLEATTRFYSGLDPQSQALFMSSSAVELQKQFQGEPCTKVTLLNALQQDGETDTNFNQQFEWLKQIIQNSDIDWRKRFVLFITGNQTLAPGIKISVRKTWRLGYVFEIHTCFNLIDLLKEYLEQDAFRK